MIKYFFAFFILFANSGFTAPKVVMATVVEFAPYIMTRGDKADGIDLEIAKELCKRISYDCIFKQMDWKLVQQSLKLGRVDVGFAGFKTPEREEYVLYLDEYFHKSTYKVFTRKDSDFEFHSFKDLHGKSFATGSGQNLGDNFNALVSAKKLSLIRFEEIQDMFKALDMGKVNGVIGNSQEYRYYLKEAYKLNSYKELDYSILAAKPSYMMVSKHSTKHSSKKLHAEINKAYNKMVEEGLREKITEKYLGPEVKKSPIFE
ncbi:MAG: transporter substrate-binding domain-containing protein [Bdellovibrionota bacterium]|nr:transporter substrate-binding domain-containing protein [Bdellovibrionota bacterium]